MKRLFILLILILSNLNLFPQGFYKYTTDLSNVKNDKIKVSLSLPELKEEEFMFVMPSVIPGSYAKKDYGRFISNFKAFDKNGNPLKVKRKNINNFYIKNIGLSRVEYEVEDTWDDTKKKNFIFQPGGSNIEEGTNFILNNHAFFGYLEGYHSKEFEVKIIHPKNMFGATYLSKKEANENYDIFVTKNYFDLADNPIMYCLPDTASFNTDNTRIHVSVYSSNNKVKADSVAKYIKPLSESLKLFFGKLPVDAYHFLFYFEDPNQSIKSAKTGLGGYGALEHHHSSFYYLPEPASESHLKEMVQDISSHEFLHILTPLNLHSEEIHDFNFNNPKMSKHLWMYEGMTEYFSWLVRLQNKQVSKGEFLKEIHLKLTENDKFKPFSFTEMSANVLANNQQKNYLNVYQKGALINMMLDINLLHLSNGQMSLKDLIWKLTEKYGPDKPFKDDELFKEMVSLSFPEIGEFIKKHIEGKEEIPYANFFNLAGISYKNNETVQAYYIGSFGLKYEKSVQKFVVTNVIGSVHDLRTNDVLLSVNNENFSMANAQSIFDKYFNNNLNTGVIIIKVIRAGKEMELSGIPLPGKKIVKHKLDIQENLSEQQKIVFNRIFNH